MPFSPGDNVRPRPAYQHDGLPKGRVVRVDQHTLGQLLWIDGEARPKEAGFYELVPPETEKTS